MSKDLLKEAIADAKAVRATAIANAKLALEEAFTPKLQSMLSTKIREEFEDEDEEEPEVDVAALAADAEGEADLEAEPAAEPEEDTEVEIYDEYDENDAPEDELEVADEEGEPSEDDLELEAILRELEDGTEAEEDFPDPTAEDPSLAEDADNEDAEEAPEEGEFDLEEVINALREEDEDEAAEEAPATEDDLEEAYATIKFLRSKINEVNLLNAKLLFSNKLFRANNLNESQKLRVIETFDRAASVREVKLVYSTLAESMVGTKGTKSSMTEGLASKSTKSTAPNKSVIVEQNNFSDRMRKLAGLI
tara:strand:+ start:101 stop:1021 length:921 start_codon:yes stop_codon:yes gene_type:complete